MPNANEPLPRLDEQRVLGRVHHPGAEQAETDARRRQPQRTLARDDADAGPHALVRGLDRRLGAVRPAGHAQHEHGRDDERRRVDEERGRRPERGDERAAGDAADDEPGADRGRARRRRPGALLLGHEHHELRVRGRAERRFRQRGHGRERDERDRRVGERETDERGGRGEIRDDHHRPPVEAIAQRSDPRPRNCPHRERAHERGREPHARPVGAVVDDRHQRDPGSPASGLRDQLRDRDPAHVAPRLVVPAGEAKAAHGQDATGGRAAARRGRPRRPRAAATAETRPPCASAMAATIERPRPTPPLARARDVSAR